MLKINLEHELLSIRKENKSFKSYLADNNKYLKEAEALLSSEEDADDVLGRLGMRDNINKAESIKKHITNESEKFGPKLEERIFTYQQIKSLALKYRLRFLNSEQYVGTIDPLLVTKIKEFEIGNKLATESKLARYERDWPRDYKLSGSSIICDRWNSFILAPAESFALQDQPIDPLFFIQLYDGRFYLLHKWGNDLSVMRRIKGFAMQNWYQFTLAWMLFTIPVLNLLLTWIVNGKYGLFDGGQLIIATVMSILTCVIYNFITHIDDKRIFSESVWDSKFK
jgi:hypothetical protein